MNLESNVQHKLPPKIRGRETGTNNTFHETRSTEASFIVSWVACPPFLISFKPMMPQFNSILSEKIRMQEKLSCPTTVSKSNRLGDHQAW